MTLRLCLSLSIALVFAAQSALAQDRKTASHPRAQAELLQRGFLDEDVAQLYVKDEYTSEHNGLRHTYLRQHWQGIAVYNGDVALHTDASGQLIKINNGAFDRLAERVNTTTPVLSADAALLNVLRGNGITAEAPLLAHDPSTHTYTYDGSAFSVEPATVALVYQPVDGRLLLAWNVSHYTPDGSHWWNVRIDALTGVELDRNDWVVSCQFDGAEHHDHDAELPSAPAPASANDLRVYPWPVESPTHGARALRNAPWLTGGIASPYGWNDTNGAAGAEYTITRGNNVYAREDQDNNNTGGYSPNGGATLDFDFPLDLTLAPTGYLDASITNLFYWNNVMHDVWYGYGFTEPAGNYQSNNYGRGGLANDDVNADALDGSGTNNANFSAPPDGQQGRMQMFRWTNTTPNRDSDLDNGVIVHEYGHGVSIRLVGGPSNSSCLNNAEQMGEGISDFMTLLMTLEPGDVGTDPRGVGTYLLGQPVTGNGIRPAPYSTSFGTNNYTYANLGTMAIPHGVGFVWCTVLWEMTWELIGVHGFNPNIYSGTGGNNIAMQLLIDGMKLMPCSPGFVDARDAILLADQINNGGANQLHIWAAFARRGLGYSASQGSSTSRTDQIAAFDLPVNANVGIAEAINPETGETNACSFDNIASVRVRNAGQAPQSGFAVRYQVNGGPVISEPFVGTLLPSTSTVHVFSTPLPPLLLGSNTLVFSTALAGDQYAGDDQGIVTYTNSAPVIVPYTEDLQSALATPPGWQLENPDGGPTWTNLSISTNGPLCTTTQAWRINYYSYNAPGQQDRLVSPQIELAGSAGSRLRFHQAYAQYASNYIDSLRVQVSADCGANWTTLWQAWAGSLATALNSSSSWIPTSCSQWQLRDIDLSAYDGQLVQVRFLGVCGFGNNLYLDNVEVIQNGVRVALQLMLEGPYDTGSGLMRDDLRAASLVPNLEPHTASGFSMPTGGGERMRSGVLGKTGNNAIVDWVLVELRTSAAPSTVLATRSALVQRDGDVVAEDGLSPIALLAPNGPYHVAVRHRNHLGCMTNSALSLSSTAVTPIDLRSPLTITYGTDTRKTMGAIQALWAGDLLKDEFLTYTGDNNDRDPMLQFVGGLLGGQVSNVYTVEDTNLDGSVRYTGDDNDRDPLLQNVGGQLGGSRSGQLP